MIQDGRDTSRESTKTNDPDRSPHLFIVGCARSGTTLLQRVVGAHPQIAVAPSMHWIASHLRAHGIKRPEDPVTPGMIYGVLGDSRFTRFKIRRRDLENLFCPRGEIPYSEFLAGIFDLYGKAEGKPLVGNKTAPYVRRMPMLHAAWPETRFVHIIRDGRDVCLSVMNWKSAGRATGRHTTWEADPISTTALWWKRKVLLGRESGNKLGPGLYHEIRYEDLVSDPERHCGLLCEFLGVPYHNAMLRYDERREMEDPGLERDHPTMPITRGARDWRSQMGAGDVERFEALAGDLLGELGYERAFPNPSPRALEHAARIRESFDA